MTRGAIMVLQKMRRFGVQSESLFDRVICSEVFEHIPDDSGAMAEIRRVLKPGGTFLICNESSGDTDKDEKWTEIIGGMTIYSGDELKTFLETAGFCNVQIHKNKMGWLCVTGQKRAE